MPAKSKSKVETSLAQNRIFLQFSKILTKTDLDSVYTDVRFAVADLKSGFNVISDFSQTRFLFLNGLGVFRSIFNFILSNDSGEIIRVIQEDRIIYKQLLNLSLRTPGYVPIYSPTVEEAESRIKALDKRNGLRFKFNQHPVEYLMDGKKLNGAIINISVSGCAIMNNEMQPELNSVIEVIFRLHDQKKQNHSFSIKSRVTRVESYAFAVSFMGIDKVIKKNLWNCIITSCSH